MELHLSRRLAEKYIFPAFDIERSSTRREELLLDQETLSRVWTLRRMIDMIGGVEALQPILTRLAKTKDNREFLDTLNKDAI